MSDEIREPNTLEEATTSELVDELHARSESVLVVMARIPKNKPNEIEEHIIHRGSWHAAVGLARCANLHFMRRFRGG